MRVHEWRKGRIATIGKKAPPTNTPWVVTSLGAELRSSREATGRWVCRSAARKHLIKYLNISNGACGTGSCLSRTVVSI